MASRPQRDPKDEDLIPLLESMWEGDSLSACCRKMGLHIPSTSAWLHADEGREAQYARAREGRAQVLLEEVMVLARSSARKKQVDGSVPDPNGVRVLLDTQKWAIGLMAEKMAYREKRDLNIELKKIQEMTDEQIEAEISNLDSDDEAPD